MRKLVFLLITVFFITFLTHGQQPQQSNFNAHPVKVVKKDNNFFPDLNFINKTHRNLFIEFSRQISTINNQFKIAKQNYRAAQKYKKSYDSIMAIVHQGAGYLSKHKIKKYRRKAVQDSVKYAQNLTKALNFCRQGYKNLNDNILKTKYARLVASELPKKQNQPNFKFRNAGIDTITKKLIITKQKITQIRGSENQHHGQKKIQDAKQICFLQKQVTNYYYDLISSIITNNPADIIKIANKYGVKQTKTVTKTELYKKYLIPVELTNIQNITNLVDDIKKLESEISKPNNSQFLKESLIKSLAEKYYALYSTVLDYYLNNERTVLDPQTISQAQALKQQAENVLTYFASMPVDPYNNMSSSDKYWLAATLLANAVVLCQKALGYYDNSKLDKNFINIAQITDPAYTTRFASNNIQTTNNQQTTAQTQTKQNRQTQNRRTANKPKPQSPKLCSNLYQYSINQAKPVIVRESGTYYRIDLGNQPADLVPTAWKDYLPLSFFKFCNSRIKHFYAGRYKTFAAANQAANEIYKKWHINTKIAKFYNGKLVKTYRRTQQKANYKTASSAKTSKYGVQIGRFSKKLSPDQLQKTYRNILNYNIHYTVSNGKYVYYIPAKDLTTAKKIKKQVRNSGINGAFIIKITQNGVVPANK